MYLILTLGVFLFGILSGPLAVKILNRMPGKCFCDYGETPCANHQSPRFACRPHGIGTGLFLCIIYTLLWFRFGSAPPGWFLMLHCLVLAMISLSDLRYSIIPDELLIAALLCALGRMACDFLTVPALSTLLSPLAGGLIGAALILALNLVGRLFYGKDALGMGDLKLLAVCGLACGHTGILIASLLGIFAAGFFFIAALALKRMKSDQFYPLGPFLVLGVCLTLTLRPLIDTFFEWYLSLL